MDTQTQGQRRQENEAPGGNYRLCALMKQAAMLESPPWQIMERGLQPTASKEMNSASKHVSQHGSKSFPSRGLGKLREYFLEPSYCDGRSPSHRDKSCELDPRHLG